MIPSARCPVLFSFLSVPAQTSVLPPFPNNMLLIISPWLACLRGWALHPGPLMGICDAPWSLLKWPTGELQGGYLWGRVLWCARVWRGRLHAALHRSVSSTAALLAGEPLPPTLSNWLAGRLTYSPSWLYTLCTCRNQCQLLGKG